jgi:hypothetical protein
MDTVTSVSSPTGPRSTPRVQQDRGTPERADDQPLSFWDMLDVINPLQHIPVVNTIYRELTGDTIKTPIKLIGATAIGGPIGFAAAMADSLLSEATGKDFGEHAMAALSGPSAGAQLADSREFVPDAIASARPMQVAAAQEFVPPPVVRESRPSAPPVMPAAMAAANTDVPSDAEAMITTAQIAAKAHVRAPMMREMRERPADSSPVNLAAGKFSAAATPRTAEHQLTMPVRRSDLAPKSSVAELRARTKVPAGARGVGSEISTASLAAAARKSKELREATAEQQYAFGQKAADGDPPTVMPGWFDKAMLSGLDKYQAMKRDEAKAPDKAATPGL